MERLPGATDLVVGTWAPTVEQPAVWTLMSTSLAVGTQIPSV